MFVKVCGVRNFHEIDWAVELGYSAIGIVVYKRSKRYVSNDKVLKLLRYAEGKILTFVVSLYREDVLKYIKYCDFIQCYEECNVKNFVYAVSKKPEGCVNFKYLIYDASKGKGEFRDFPDWVSEYRDKIILAGGLNYKNVREVIENFKPFGVDVSSGVEIDGKKDFNLMRKFIDSIRRR